MPLTSPELGAKIRAEVLARYPKPKPPVGPPPRHVLYRWFDRGELLYVGISYSLLSRIVSHKETAAWFDRADTMTIEHFASREEARAAERIAIATEGPLYNIKA